MTWTHADWGPEMKNPPKGRTTQTSVYSGWVRLKGELVSLGGYVKRKTS